MPAEHRFPSIDALRAFEAAARLGTFERAAEALDVTASAVGKRIATLEALLGAPVFTRTGKALVLTASGREYLAQVRAALGLLEAMPQHQRTVQRRRRLRVCVPPTFARQILVPQLEPFTSAHPDIELEVVLSIPYLDASGGDADVVVRLAAPGAGRVLMHDVLLPMAAPALLARTGPLDSPAALARAPLLRTPIEPWAPWLRAAGLDDTEPAQGPRLVDLGLVLEAAVAGQGVALGRPSLARHWLASGALVVPLRLAAAPAQQYQVRVQAAADGASALFEGWLAGCCEAAAAAALEAVSGPA